MHKTSEVCLLKPYGGIALTQGHKLLHCFRDLIQAECWRLSYASSLSPVSAYESWLSLCCSHAASALCISPPPLRLDVTNSWICTFLYQNQHAPHHRLVQIWSEHTQNPPAARWWIGILATMLMHQSAARRQMTVNCFSDKSVVWDSTDWGWIEAVPWWCRRGVGVGGGGVFQETLSEKSDDDPTLFCWDMQITSRWHQSSQACLAKAKGEIEQSAALQRRESVVFEWFRS